jgi:hypothetical protein
MSAVRFPLVFVVFPLLLLGGSTVSIPVADIHIYSWTISDGTTVDGEVTSACSPGGLSPASDPIRCIFPPDRTFRFVQLGITLAEAFTTVDEEDCQFTLRVGAYDDATGDEISSSLIVTGEAVANAAETCQSTELTLNALHEQCTRTIDPTDANATCSGGCWWDIVAEDADGADSCKEVRAANLFLVVEEQ